MTAELAGVRIMTFIAAMGIVVAIGLSFTPKRSTPLPTIQGIKLPNTIQHRFLVYDIKAGAWVYGIDTNPADPSDPWTEPTPIPK